MIAMSIKLTARFHSVLSAGPRFGVSVLAAELEHEARRFAG